MADELRELQRLFHEAVMVGGPYQGEHPLTTPLLARNPPLCWFWVNVPGIDECGGDYGAGRLEAAHWIKRQRVERDVKQLSSAVRFQEIANWEGETLRPETDAEMLARAEWILHEMWMHAAWDSRNGVPACERHHRNFDGHRVPLPSEQIVVPRLLVPDHVVEFTDDYGLETALEDKHPLEV